MNGIAPKVGQIGQLLVVENLSLGGVRRLYQRHFLGDQHAFRYRTNVQADIDDYELLGSRQ